MDRRRFLRAGVVVSSASVAGCVGDILSGSQQSVFKDISRQGTNLIVKLNPGADIRQVNLITPDGTKANQARLGAGESRTVISLLNRDFVHVKYVYTPGTNTLVAIDENQNQYKQKVPLKPRLSATSISLLGKRNTDTYANYERYTNPVIAVKNTGSAPALVIESAVQGSSVPASKELPDDSLTLDRRDLSAELEQLGRKESSDTPLKNRGTQSIVTIPPNASVTVITGYHPLGFPATATSMGEHARQHLHEKWGGRAINATAILAGRTGRLKIPFTVHFGGAVKPAITAGKEYMFFNKTEVTDSSLQSSK